MESDNKKKDLVKDLDNFSSLTFADWVTKFVSLIYILFSLQRSRVGALHVTASIFSGEILRG